MGRTLVSNEDTQHQTLKRVSYRLFPVVTPTPPASPVFSRLAQNVDSLQRRSSSLSDGVDPSALPLPHTTTSPSTQNAQADSQSVFDLKLRPTSAVVVRLDPDCRRATFHPFSQFDSTHVNPDGRLNQSSSAPIEETGERCDTAPTITMTFNVSTETTGPGTKNNDYNDLTSIFPLAPTSTHHQQHRKRVRSKPKPNLRINVFDDGTEDRPPPPPPKSPRLLPPSASKSSTVESQSPPAILARKVDPYKPAAVPALSAQTSSHVSLTVGLKAKEVFVQTNLPRGRPSRKLLPQLLSSNPGSTAEKSSSLARKPVCRLDSPPSASSPLDEMDKPPPPPSYMLIDATKTGSPVNDVQRTRYIPYRPLTASQIQQEPEQISQKTEPLQWTSRVHSPDALGNANNTYPPVNLLSRHDGIRSASPGEIRETPRSLSASTPLRRVMTAAGPLNSHPYIASPMIPPVSKSSILEPRTFSWSRSTSVFQELPITTSTPQTTESTTSGSPERSDRSQSPAPDMSTGMFSRAITPEISSTASRSSSVAFMDPVERLKELTERCEVLHGRYASLRADRQKISSGIISSLKESKPEAETMNTLLDEQLSLAAVSSAMDICFAKLQALDCQKEDAIAALIAQVGSLKRTAIDSIAGSPARNTFYRQPWRSPSLESRVQFRGSVRDSMVPEPIVQPIKLVINSKLDTQPEDADSSLHEMTPKAYVQQSPFSMAPAVDTSPKTDSVISGDLPRTPLLLDEQLDPNTDVSSPSVLEEILPVDALDEGTHKVRVEGAKVAKILGLLVRSTSCRNPASERLPDGFEDMIMLKQPELELEISSVIKPLRPSSRDSSFPNIEAPTSAVPHDDKASGDLPSKNSDGRSPQQNASAVPPGSHSEAPAKSLVQRISEENDVPSSPKSLKSVKSFKSFKSYKSTKQGYLHQTIKVFMDEDILEYYRALQGWSPSTG